LRAVAATSARVPTRDRHSDRNCPRGRPRCLSLGMDRRSHLVSPSRRLILLPSPYTPPPSRPSSSLSSSLSLSLSLSFSPLSLLLLLLLPPLRFFVLGAISTPLLARDVSLAVTLSGITLSITSMQRFADCVIEGEDGTRIVREREREREKRRDEEMPILATCIHVLVSRSASANENSERSIDMRPTRVA